MCSIFKLQENYTLPYEMLFNAMHNNEHGWGLLLKDNSSKKIEMRKNLDEKVDPEALHKILTENEDVERWVHLRNSSKGSITGDNVQPFQLYHSKGRDVFFMHNGTIYNTMIPDMLKSAITEELDEKENSDSKIFAFSRIQPLLTRMKGNKGFGDISDPVFMHTIGNIWTSNWGRAVLVSNDIGEVYLNRSGWETIKAGNGEFIASNDQYFKSLIRGKLYDQKKKEEDEKRAKNRSVTVSSNYSSNTNDKNSFTLSCTPFEQTLALSKEIVHILEEYDLYTPEGFIAMGYLDQSEFEALVKDNPKDAATMFLYLTSFLKDAQETIDEQEEKLQKQEKHIENMSLILKERKSGDVHVG